MSANSIHLLPRNQTFQNSFEYAKSYNVNFRCYFYESARLGTKKLNRFEVVRNSKAVLLFASLRAIKFKREAKWTKKKREATHGDFERFFDRGMCSSLFHTHLSRQQTHTYGVVRSPLNTTQPAYTVFCTIRVLSGFRRLCAHWKVGESSFVSHKSDWLPSTCFCFRPLKSVAARWGRHIRIVATFFRTQRIRTVSFFYSFGLDLLSDWATQYFFSSALWIDDRNEDFFRTTTKFPMWLAEPHTSFR